LVLFDLIWLYFLAELGTGRVEPKSPQSPTKPARSYILLPTNNNQTSISFDQLKSDISRVKTEEAKRALISDATPVQAEKINPTPVEIPIAITNSFSYERNPPREINGFKLTNVDTTKPKDPTPKELVSILKNSDAHNVAASLKQNGSRHPSSDSGRASPPSSPSASPSPTSSAVSAEASMNGSNGVSRSGSGASSGSNGLPEKSHTATPINTASYQLPLWPLPDHTKSSVQQTQITSFVKSEPERFRRVITTEL
jgi:hypothetical protein